jgi:hypothetical protein
MPYPIEKLIIQFDSSAALLKSLALYHHQQDFAKGGLVPGIPSWASHLVNRTPRLIRQHLYSWSGWVDALRKPVINHINPYEVAQWAVSLYPPKEYPGICFGSSNGAAIHLAAALGIPWLPQTYLVAVRRMMKADQIHKDIAWGQKVIAPFLKNNPHIHASQMHDPVQDRLMVTKMGYFRLKFLNLPDPFCQFISNHIDPMKPLISIECDYPWPSLHVQERHTFQLGGFGAIEPYEYLSGSSRTKEFLKKVHSPVSHWETFKPSGEMPESEWGYYPHCHQQLFNLAKRNNAPFYRFIFHHPEGMSDFTCDLYQWWYQKRLKFKSLCLLIENFALIAPYRSVISGTLPFWLAFNTENSASRLEGYLKTRTTFEELYLLLMSNGVTEGIGLTTIERWNKILQHASIKGSLIGVDEREYPLDFATFLRYQSELVRLLPQQNEVPEPLTLEEIKEFLNQSPYKYSLTLKEESLLNSNSR